MILNRYISTLLNFNINEINKGIDEINLNFNNTIKFKDKLLCLIISNDIHK